MTTLRCLNCGRAAHRDANPHFPFCSQRCQQIDLGRWLKEKHGLPWEDPNKLDADEEWNTALDEDPSSIHNPNES